MTNWQIKHVTPGGLGKDFTILCNDDRRVAWTIGQSHDYDIYGRNIRTLSIRRLA